MLNENRGSVSTSVPSNSYIRKLRDELKEAQKAAASLAKRGTVAKPKRPINVKGYNDRPEDNVRAVQEYEEKQAQKKKSSSSSNSASSVVRRTYHNSTVTSPAVPVQETSQVLAEELKASQQRDQTNYALWKKFHKEGRTTEELSAFLKRMNAEYEKIRETFQLTIVVPSKYLLI